jgi:predicted glycosyltransferase
MKTALQQAIERLDIKIKTVSDVREHNEHADVVLRILKQERAELIALLPIEQQQIEEAWQSGKIDGKNIGFNGIAEHDNSYDYYTKNYDNEQTTS